MYDEGSRRLIDFVASKRWFCVQAQLSLMEKLLSPDTWWASGQHTTPVKPEWITVEPE